MLGVNEPATCPNCGEATKITRSALGWAVLVVQLAFTELLGWVLLGLAGVGLAAIVYWLF